MNVDVVGRIRPARRPEQGHSLLTSAEGKTIYTALGGGASCRFQEVFDQNASTQKVFSRTVEPLLNVFTEGMNVCIVAFGETGSGKSYTLIGEKNDRLAIIPLAIDYIFGAPYLQNLQATAMWSLTISMYEIYAEVLKDLLDSSGMDPANLKITCNAQDGTFIKGLNRVAVSSAADATSTFRHGWARRTGASTDFGPAASHATVVTQLDLLVQDGNEMHPTKSSLQIVDLPGAEKLADDKNTSHFQESHLLNKSLHVFAQVVSDLASTPYPDRVINYSESKLTQLTQEAFGGNCKTRVICCLPPMPETNRLAAVLRTCSTLSQVKNFPVLNDYFVESLVTQYRARILALQLPSFQEMGTKGDGEKVNLLRDQIRRVNNENVQLRDRNERLYTKLGDLQGKMGQMAGSKTDLSSKLVFSEEEKLKISKDLIDLQIQTNKIREQYEAENFELKSKILFLENRIVELELQKDKCTHEYRTAKDCLRVVEKSRKELADEYIVLKTNYMTLSKQHENEVAKNDELSLELLNLANSKNSLTRKQDEYAKSRAIYDEATTELNRVKDLVARLSCQKMKPEEVFVPESERGTFERNLLGNQDQIKEQIEVMKQNYEKQQTAMEERIVKMGKELQEAKRGIRNTQHKLAEQTVALLGSQSQLKEVEMENSQLQLHLKELNEEYRMRLVRYIEDVTDYVDNTVKSGNDNTKPPPADHPYLKRFVDSMLKDIRSAYRSREEQLATAARNYKKRMQNVFKKHEHLLIAYRMQREQILSLGTKDLDPGPSEITFAITDSELLSKQSQELNRLREDKAHLEAKLQDLQEKVRLGRISAPVISSSLPETDGKDANESWSELRRQLREFTFTTQEDLERERAQLISRVTVAEEQLAELQEYVDKHLGRYKQEITRLRKLVGTEVPRAPSADALHR
ncbi:coiled-coil domain-containing protein 78 isoform X1 [Scyliorhinus canicula]|uniref:coiled-coil domain-containing protein 78 isoform X1 n=3 Tax=Scyliorhinus canicula TaxID=7830 RepID=UPI0018F77C19|nr:coiled-coil domain-containing protein 78 isoform X1 [Scyliorhinus canicula]XP_038676748.1 coiled-coil domain-containing protein 78 isoform X1 [Scyliorhinus canicula]